MPLSEHEQRLLEQMERALYAEDPKFATSMRNTKTAAGDRKRIAIGIVGFLAGMGLLVGGVASQVVPIGVLGFILMLGGMWLVVVGVRPEPGAAPAGVAGSATGPQMPVPSTAPRRRPRGRRPSGHGPRHGQGSLSERMEQRWRRRREKGDI